MRGLEDIKSALSSSELEEKNEFTVDDWERIWDGRQDAFVEAYGLLGEGRTNLVEFLEFISKYSQAFSPQVIPALVKTIKSYKSGSITIDMAQQNAVQLLTLPITDPNAAMYVGEAGGLAHFTDDQFDILEEITEAKMLKPRFDFLINLELTLRAIHQQPGMPIGERADLFAQLTDQYLYKALNYQQMIPSYAIYFSVVANLPEINKYAHFLALFTMIDAGYAANAAALYKLLDKEDFERFTELYGHEAMQNSSYFQRAVSETYLNLLKLAYSIPESAAGMKWLASSERLFITLSDFMKIKTPEDKLTLEELSRIGRSLIEIPGFMSIASSVYALLSTLSGYDYSEEKILMAFLLDGIVGPLVWGSNSEVESKTWTGHSFVVPKPIQSVTLEELLKLAKFCWHYLKNYAENSAGADVKQLMAEFKLILVSHNFFKRGMNILFSLTKENLANILQANFAAENGHISDKAEEMWDLIRRLEAYTDLETSTTLSKFISDSAAYEVYWEVIFKYISGIVHHHDYLLQEPLVSSSSAGGRKYSQQLANARLWQNNYHEIAEDIRNIAPEVYHQADAVMIALAGLELTLKDQQHES